MNYDILKLELQDAAYAAMTDSEATEDLNALVVDAKQAISAHDIRKYLMLVDKLLPIEASALESARAATRALDIFPLFDISEMAVETKLIAVLDDLITDNLIDATDKTNILSLGATVTSRAQLLGLGTVSEWHVIEARSI
jgi:hypothetical protein